MIVDKQARITYLLAEIDAGRPPSPAAVGAALEDLETALRRLQRATEAAEYWYVAWRDGDTEAALGRPDLVPSESVDWLDRP